MPFSVRTFYSCPSALGVAVDDVTRTVRFADGIALLSGSVSTAPFEVLSTARSHEMLDLCQRTLQGCEEAAPGAAATEVFDGAQAFLRGLGAECCGWLTLSILIGESCLVTWLGGDEVWLSTEQSRVVHSTGHTLRNGLASSAVPNVLTRGLGATYRDEPCPAQTSWNISASGSAALLSRPLVQLSDDEFLQCTQDPGRFEQMVAASGTKRPAYALFAQWGEVI